MKILNNQLCLLSSFNFSSKAESQPIMCSSKLCSTSDLISRATNATSTSQLAKPPIEPNKNRKFKLNCPHNGLVTKMANHRTNPNMFLLIN